MDIIKLLFDLSDLNDIEYKDVLLKKIKNEYYYVIDFSNSKGKWELNLLKVEGKSSDIVKRIRLYDQPSASKIGVSLPSITYLGKKNITKILETTISNGLSVSSLTEILDLLKSDKLIYPETDKDVIDLFGDKYKVFSGYTTLSVNGRYVVDETGYDTSTILDLYESMKKGICVDDFCSLCGSKDDLIHGGYKEPGWKLLSTTRTTEVCSNGRVFIRCDVCEKKVMLGMNLLQRMVKNDFTKIGNYERVIIPLVKDKRWFEKLESLRKEYDSDLAFYGAVDRLVERLEIRGIENYLYIRLLKNQRSYAVLDIREIRKEDIHKLRKKEAYEKLLWENKWLSDGKELSYYPTELIEYEDNYKWKLIERVKRYWLDLEFDKNLWNEIEKLSGKDLTIYRLWKDYLLKGDKFVEDIKSSQSYILGKLMSKARKLQMIDKGSSGIGSISSIQKRFYGYPNDFDRVFNEVMAVIDYRINKLGRIEREEIQFYIDLYVSSSLVGDSKGYYLGLYER
jgi:hypothetical protein